MAVAEDIKNRVAVEDARIPTVICDDVHIVYTVNGGGGGRAAPPPP